MTHMMKIEHNPAYLAIELELREMQAKLQWMERMYGEAYGEPKSNKFSLDGYDAGEITLKGMDNPTVKLVRTAEIAAAVDLGANVQVTARTSGKNAVGLQYFCTATDLNDARNHVALLGHLHERFNRQLAEFLRKGARS